MSIVSELVHIHSKMQKDYQEKPYPTYRERIELLDKIKKNLLNHEQEFYSALKTDYGYRSSFDSMLSDFLPSMATIKYTKKHLKKWMKNEKRHAGLLIAPSKVQIMYQPLGVVGIIVPWNFPLYLSLSPIITAIAAGNKVMVKLSEFTPQTNKVIAKVFKNLSDDIKVIEGASEVSSAFSNLAFDHILFTGSTKVGKLVAKSAANNLTPTTLELGGKSPMIVDNDISMESVIDAVLPGKCLNSGQICVATDYIFLPKNRVNEFIEIYRKKFNEYYNESINNNHLTWIVNKNHHERLLNLIEDAENKGAKIHKVVDKTPENGSTQLYPHLLTDVSEDMNIMQEEIFGPLLPIKTYDQLEDAIRYINNKPRPLALYILSNNHKVQQNILKRTHSGGVCINDSLIHVAAEDAPFGGIGDSGMGHYHGREGFLTFSKAKTILSSPSWLPKNKYILKHRDFFFKILRKVFI